LGEQEKLRERMKKLESLSNIVAPPDELADKSRDIAQEFGQGGRGGRARQKPKSRYSG